ncbi:MAG: DUF342 domain-containing protein, partial [Candidatus Eisenbacteria sp.]|nr:DUF342 domain-containing protein [Candidatus Eisenbacteria bacterium]
MNSIECEKHSEETRVDEGFEPSERTEHEVSAGRVVIETDEGGFLAALSLYPEGSNVAFSEAELITILGECGVTTGLEIEEIQRVISQVASSVEPVERAIIAKGQKPVPGQDAYLEHTLIDSLEKDETDPKDPKLFCQRRIVNVLAGHEIAVYYPPENGIAGLTVRGMPIPVKHGADTTPKPSRNIRREGSAFTAGTDGRLVIEDGALYVDEELRINEALTPAFGDVDFVGKLVVNGDVEAGLRIRIEKDVEVYGSVIGTDLLCKGNMKVRNGIIGSGNTEIVVNGDLEVDFVENAVLKVRGACTVRDNFATSTLICSDTLTVMQGRGLFLSGSATVRNEIKVKNVGNSEGGTVKFFVGRDLLAEEEKRAIESEIERLELVIEELKKLEKAAGPTTATYRSLSQSKREGILARLDELPPLEEELADAREANGELESQIVPVQSASVTVVKTLYPDVIVEFPIDRIKVHTALSGVTIVFDEEESRIE